MNTRREELQKLSIKNGLRPIAKSLGIKNISKMNKNFLINSIIDFERTSILTPTQSPYPAPRSIFSSQRKIFPTLISAPRKIFPTITHRSSPRKIFPTLTYRSPPRKIFPTITHRPLPTPRTITKKISSVAKTSWSWLTDMVSEFGKSLINIIPEGRVKNKVKNILENMKSEVKEVVTQEEKDRVEVPPPQVEAVEVRETKSALRGRVIDIIFRNIEHITDIPAFFRLIKNKVIDNLNNKQNLLEYNLFLIVHIM